MAEAEDVITDVARHATVYAQAVWRRHRAVSAQSPALTLIDVAPRIDLLIAAVFGASVRIRVAQLPAPATFLAKAFRRRERPRAQRAVPATDDACIWLPLDAGIADPALALERFRTAALQQAMRASRGSAAQWCLLRSGAPQSAGRAGAVTPTFADAAPLVRDLYLLVEANAADEALARRLPGIVGSLNALRRAALAARPPLASFAEERRPLEAFVQALLRRDCGSRGAGMPESASPEESACTARRLAAEIVPDAVAAQRLGGNLLFKDWWTGELRAPNTVPGSAADSSSPPDHASSAAIRSARLTRRPDVRDAGDEEEDTRQGAWMIQSAQPQQHAEDPFGMQRPTDRDETTAAEEFAGSLDELAQARLVSTPGPPKEVLLSDDPPDARTRQTVQARVEEPSVISYPEWDWRIGAYQDPGATVRLLPAQSGPQRWVDDTLAAHRPVLDAIRRRFEMLRAQRVQLRRQPDGDELDLEACIDSRADLRAGLPMSLALYQSHRRARRDMAIVLLIDVSGSTDGWVSANRRVIDVEREALLLVCIALAGMGEPYSVQAFSGQGPAAVTVRTLKRFDEPYGDDVARRIAALEPQQYTRSGAALRHASTTLMRQPATHRLLLLLSDGKPNDVDRYEGRYGVEDTRQAVVEAKLQGVFPFCLTVDRNAASYLPAVFGERQYALLTSPELLPIVLLDWMRRLVSA